MMEVIRELCRFFEQKYHVPIEIASGTYQLDSWDRNGVLVGMPDETEADRVVDDLAFGYDANFGKQLGGDLIVMHDLPMARVGKQSLVLLFLPTNPKTWELVRQIVEKHLPRLCRTARHGLRDQLVASISECVKDRKRELQSSIREDAYELERMSLQMIQISRKLETDRQVLKMFERAPDWIKARATRTFVDLVKLVPATYASFHIENHSITGTTHPIDIEHDGCSYHFDAYEVEADLRQGKVRITGGTESNGYIHPHVTDESTNICWGNIGGLVSRLIGELDLFGLFQLVHQFLTTYNESDPFQKIEKWDPNWEDPEEEEEPYCSWCDSYGHEIEDCDQCWWCEHCQQYDDHDEENCPNRPKEESEEAHAVAAEQAA